MSRILSALKAVYNFFSGDAILLSAAIIAFALGWLLAHELAAPNILVGLLFVAIIVAGLAVTLGREIAGRARQR